MKAAVDCVLDEASVESFESEIELRDLMLDAKFFSRRRSSRRAPFIESEALLRLTRALAGRPESVLQELVELVVEASSAESAGITLEQKDEHGQMRLQWIAVAGTLAEEVNRTVPGLLSPCGGCLTAGRAQLYRGSRSCYGSPGMDEGAEEEAIVIPWSNQKMRGTLWAVSHAGGEVFDIEDYRLLRRLAEFAPTAVRHHSRRRVRKPRYAASAESANEMAHLINNPLQRLTNTIYLAQQGGASTEVYLREAGAELNNLSEVVRMLLLA